MNSNKISSTLVMIIFYLTIISHVLISTSAYQCYVCDSAKDTNCLKDLGQKTDCGNDITACYTKIDESFNVIRGCLTETIHCDSDKNCEQCSTGNNCNDNIICKQCGATANADNIKACAQTNVTDAKYNKVCPLANKHCISLITVDQTTKRDCASDADKEECAKNGDTCKICDGINCNTGIYPENRLQCYQCTNCNDLSNANAMPCLLYSKDDKCYQYGESEAGITRGCQTDADAKCKSDSQDTLCVHCTTASCNSLTYKRKPKLSCHQCDSKETTDCIKAQNTGNAVLCKTDILYYQNQTELCYTQHKEDIVYRGCLYDRATELGACTEQLNCETCATDACNNEAQAFTCIICRSDEEPLCYSRADQLTGKECTNTENAANEGCYIGNWKNIVIRGCYTDLYEQQQFQCNDPSDTACKRTQGANSNTEAYNSAATLQLGTILLMILCFIAFCKLNILY